MEIAIATGTRADWGLLLPLARALREDHGVHVIATYMHLFPDMGHTVDEIRADGFDPDTVETPRQPAEATAAATAGFSRVLRSLRPDCIVILGDRFEMLGVASAALLERVPIVHIAGGTVSEGAFDDSVRNAISCMASLHFPETDMCAARLRAMGVAENNVVVSGALGVWNAGHTPLLSLGQLEESIGFRLGERFLLGTFHPATLERLNPREQMREWLMAVKDTLDSHPEMTALLTYPNSDTDPAPLIEMMHALERDMPGRVKVVSSLGRVRYLSASRLAAVVSGNSSSGIVEVPSAGTPVVDTGIRQQGRERSRAVIHAPLERAAITAAHNLALSPECAAAAAMTPNPYYRDDTPGIMTRAIRDFF